MALMRVVVDPEAAGTLSVAEVEEPEPALSETLVLVAAVSLNRGESGANQRGRLEPRARSSDHLPGPFRMTWLG